MVVFTLISITSVSMDKRFDIKIADLYRENRYKLFIHAYNLVNDEENAKDIVKMSFVLYLKMRI